MTTSVQGRAVTWVRDLTYAHPRARMRLREAWGLTRDLSHRLHLPAPFEPSEFSDLRTLRSEPAATPGRILVVSQRGWSTHVVWEATIGHALRARGVEPVFLTCGGRLPICDVAPITAAPPMPCHSCRGYAVDGIEAAGFAPIQLRDLVDIRQATRVARARVARLTTVSACEAYSLDKLPLGAWVRASVAWFLSRGTLPDDAETMNVYRRFLISGSVLVRGFHRLLDRVQPQRIFLLNCSFFPERILAEMAIRRDIPVVWYEKGFLTDSLILGRWFPGTDILDPGPAAWQEALDNPLTTEEEVELDTYLGERVSGGRTFDNFWVDRIEDLDEVRRGLALAGDRPLVALFSNLVWDSAIQDQDVGFASMRHWVLDAIRWARQTPEIDLVIRIHPAEVRIAIHPTRERMADVIAGEGGTLPNNVRLVLPESPISSYTLMRAASVGLVYSSTSGLEMATLGIPVVAAAAAHFTRRGFTHDPADRESYWATVERLIARLPDDLERARWRDLSRRYAHLFWFRYHHIPGVVREDGRSRPRVAVAGAAGLAPGISSSFDNVLDGILAADGPVVAPRHATSSA